MNALETAEADVYPSRDPVALHPGRCVHRVPEQTVARHLDPNHSGHHRSSVHTDSDLAGGGQHTHIVKYNRYDI